MYSHPGVEALNKSLQDQSAGSVSPVVAQPAEVKEEIAKPADITPKLWAVFGDTYSPCEKATKEMPPGHYLIRSTQERGIFFSKKAVNMDKLMILPDSASEEIVQGIEKFWTKEAHYRKFEFLWKRGVLLFGPPGSGKTSTVQIIASKIVEKGGLAIYAYNPSLTIQGLDILRYIEPKRPIVVVLEDLDDIVDRHGEAELLSLLDGEFQIDNAVFLATTNYLEELDERIVNRPSRFDIVKNIGMPSDAARKVFLLAKNPRLAQNEKELEKWVEDTKDYSIAHMKELIISIECLELPYDEVIERLNRMMSSDLNEEGLAFGFTSGATAKLGRDRTAARGDRHSSEFRP